MSAQTVALLEKACGALLVAQDLRRGALAAALALVGEKEQGGPNQGPPVEFSIGYWTQDEPGPWALWCAGFASTCYLVAEATLALRAQLGREPQRFELEAQLGRRSPWREVGSLSCPRLWQRCAARGWTRLLSDAEPGDLVFFHSRSAPDLLEHVGLVVELRGRVLTTVEGNAGDAVRKRTHDVSFDRLHGLARPQW